MINLVNIDFSRKKIIVFDYVVTLDMENLYDQWRYESVHNFYQTTPAFIKVGGQPLNKQKTQFTPVYYFMHPEWSIIYIGTGTLTIRLNLYDDNSSSIVRTQRMLQAPNGGSIHSMQSDVQIIEKRRNRKVNPIDRLKPDFRPINCGCVHVKHAGNLKYQNVKYK